MNPSSSYVDVHKPHQFGDRVLGIIGNPRLKQCLGESDVLPGTVQRIDMAWVSCLSGKEMPVRLVVAVIVIIAGSFYPVYKADYPVEVQLWIDALPVPGSWCYLSGYHRWAGVLWGGAALDKPHYGLCL